MSHRSSGKGKKPKTGPTTPPIFSFFRPDSPKRKNKRVRRGKASSTEAVSIQDNADAGGGQSSSGAGVSTQETWDVAEWRDPYEMTPERAAQIEAAQFAISNPPVIREAAPSPEIQSTPPAIFARPPVTPKRVIFDLEVTPTRATYDLEATPTPASQNMFYEYPDPTKCEIVRTIFKTNAGPVDAQVVFPPGIDHPYSQLLPRGVLGPGGVVLRTLHPESPEMTEELVDEGRILAGDHPDFQTVPILPPYREHEELLELLARDRQGLSDGKYAYLVPSLRAAPIRTTWDMTYFISSPGRESPTAPTPLDPRLAATQTYPTTPEPRSSQQISHTTASPFPTDPAMDTSPSSPFHPDAPLPPSRRPQSLAAMQAARERAAAIIVARTAAEEADKAGDPMSVDTIESEAMYGAD